MKKRYLLLGGFLIVFIVIVGFVISRNKATSQTMKTNVVGDIGDKEAWNAVRPKMNVDLLTINEYSRPGTPLKEVNSIVIHYTANPGSTAQNNRDYFEGLRLNGDTYASSHFVVGIDGEVVQCVPTSEVAYTSNKRNDDTIAIEVCHLDESGEFTDETYDSLVELTGWLCGYLNVEPSELLRHYDITGKACPKYYVDHEDEWLGFKKDVEKWIINHK